ncbi:hypothetical protein BZARG_1293 [Bizionia argentinensis JUB59]|uniref:Uncharacterized protein n=1 Tax=Bizionia argentinensis JUB59 TaxID=1046627 RepID=G2EDE4_9FLAO|nr:DUF6371 domain-containing protein [Bizionia argentinensis]EGV43507.2 hypothetical protein BZARG_1293 [Bizionia argentinensis JUB59]
MNNTYKYQLDKSSKKFRCPQCQKNTLVKYIETETKHYLDHHIGRCDREGKCAYHFTPKGNTPISILPENYKPEIPTYHKDDTIAMFGKNHMENNFILYLLQFFPSVDVEEVIQKFFIGTSNHWKGATVFLQVDECITVHAGKVMLYDAYTGKRVKKPFSYISWLHRVLHIKDFVLQQCLFGFHNLCESDIKTVGIVESEKTAIILSIFRRDIIWMATGSKSNFKSKLLKPLQDRKIIAFPDKTEFQDWNKTAKQLKKKGYSITCSHLLESLDLDAGDDLVDFLLPSKKVA